MNVPIIECVPEKKGYWVIYPDQKIWHDEQNMSFKNYKEIGEKYGVNEGGNWMKLEEGPNKVRLVSVFKDYGTHFDEKLQKSFICIGKDNCGYCKLGNKSRVQFKGWVIDRKDDKIKILTIGYKIYSQIGELANSDQYGFGDIPNYDITISKSGQKLATKYNVIPDRKDTSLTKEEDEQISQLQSPEEIIENEKNKLLEEDTEEEKEIDVKKIPF